MTAFRLVVTEPLDGAANMALDEALLLSRLGGGPPTVRFYAWAPPTLSLGYGQLLHRGLDLDAAAGLGIGLVRRPTGGSAILHEGPERELTYSVVAAGGDFEGAGDLLVTYRWIGAALVAGLRAMGAPVEMVPVQPSDAGVMPAFCFARAGSFELEVAGRKIAGSAQRRQGGGFLQHGSVMLGADPDRLARVFPGADPLGAMTTLEAVLGHRPSFDETATRLAEGFREVHALRLEPGGLTGAELALAERLTREKYETEAWTRRSRAAASRAPLTPALSPLPTRPSGAGGGRG
ncbi:MAG: lipoate--protein ligase family protein [Candidatus Rokubacteria bacterium]|nr:lipoate--protein ligase family protein [Candidatus Rokubacteria bacterium]